MKKIAQAITTVCRVYRVNPSLPPTPQHLPHSANLLSVAGLLIFRLPPMKDMQPPTNGSRVARQASRRYLCHQQGEPAITANVDIITASCSVLPPAKHSLRLQAKTQSLIIAACKTWAPAKSNVFFSAS